MYPAVFRGKIKKLNTLTKEGETLMKHLKRKLLLLTILLTCMYCVNASAQIIQGMYTVNGSWNVDYPNEYDWLVAPLPPPMGQPPPPPVYGFRVTIDGGWDIDYLTIKIWEVDKYVSYPLPHDDWGGLWTPVGDKIVIEYHTGGNPIEFPYFRIFDVHFKSVPDPKEEETVPYEVIGSTGEVVEEGQADGPAGPVTAVALSDLSVTKLNRDLLLKWSTEIEIDNVGFNLYRLDETGISKVNKTLIPAAGETVVGKEYTFVDEGAADGRTSYYLLESIDLSGKSDTFVFPVSDSPQVLSPEKKLAKTWGGLKTQ
jgi:hypothetical protein